MHTQRHLRVAFHPITQVVFYGEVMPTELVSDGTHLRLGHPVHPNPGETVVRLHDLVGFVKRAGVATRRPST